MRIGSRALRRASIAALLLPLPALSASAGGLFYQFDLEDRMRAQQRNVSAIKSEVVNVAPPGMIMTSIGRVSRRAACLPGADCSRPAVVAGNYLRATTRAPWIVYMLNIGTIERRGDAHEAGELAAHNVIDVPRSAMRPGGMIVRAFGMGRLVQDLK